MATLEELEARVTELESCCVEARAAIEDILTHRKSVLDLPIIVTPPDDNYLNMISPDGNARLILIDNLLNPPTTFLKFTQDNTIDAEFTMKIAGTAGKKIHIQYDNDNYEDVTFTGRIQNVVGFTYLDLDTHVISITGDLSDITHLENLKGNFTAFDITDVPNIVNLFITNSPITSVDLTANTKLIELTLINSLLTTINIDNNILLKLIGIQNNLLTETAVDYIIDKLDDFGLSNGALELGIGGNAPPSAAGLVSKANLEGKGWTVTVNS